MLTEESIVRTRGSSDSRLLWAAWSIWLGTFVVQICALLAHVIHPLPYGVYADAGRHWLRRQPLYDLHTIDGFQYFPPAALMFSAFARLGSPWGGVAWRALNWLALAFAIRRVAAQLQPTRADACCAIAIGLAVIPASGSLGNGQANLTLAALSLLVSADLAESRWWRASALLAIGVGLKPLMAVFLLLAWPLYPVLVLRIPLALAAVFGLPWLLRDPSYVARQYADCWRKLGLCATPDRLFEDLRSLLASLGLLASHHTYMALRGLAAVFVFVLAWYTRKRFAEPHASFLVGTFASGYLMLFNPRTLSSSYVLVAAPAALLSAVYILGRRWAPSVALSSILVCWTVSYRVLPFIEHWLRPLACIGFWAVLAWLLASSVESRRPIRCRGLRGDKR